MRRFTTALAAIAVIGLMVAAGAGALTSALHVSLSADKTSVTYPAVVTLTATVSGESSDTPHAALFQVRSADSTQWVSAGSVESATGRFALLAMPNAKNSYYRASIGDTMSAPVYVAVHVPMGAPSTATRTVRAGRTMRLTGTIRPFHPLGVQSVRLYWERYDAVGRKWRSSGSSLATVTTAIDNDTSQWSFALLTRPGTVGSFRVRSFHECPRHTSSYSPWTSVTIVR